MKREAVLLTKEKKPVWATLQGAGMLTPNLLNLFIAVGAVAVANGVDDVEFVHHNNTMLASVLQKVWYISF